MEKTAVNDTFIICSITTYDISIINAPLLTFFMKLALINGNTQSLTDYPRATSL